MTTPRTLALFVVAAGLLWACGPDEPGPEPTDTSAVSDTEPDTDAGDDADVVDPLTCDYVEDGVCDEPANCPLGTDAVDCDAACAVDEVPAHLWGACRYREQGVYDPSAVAIPDGARPSDGSGGARGRYYETMSVPGPEGNPRLTEERHFEVYVPYAYDGARPAPLVFYGGGFGDEMYPNSAYTELESLAELNGFILVNAQQAFRDFGDRGYRHSWYTYNQAWLGDWDALPDIAFLTGVVERLGERYNLDLNRVVMTGTSRGGAISILMGLLAPDVFSAFVSHAGFLYVNDFDDFILETYAGPRVPAFIVVGAQDTNVGTEESDIMDASLRARGWTDDDVVYHLVDPGGHQWQTQLSQEWYDFVMARPMGTREEAE